MSLIRTACALTALLSAPGVVWAAPAFEMPGTPVIEGEPVSFAVTGLEPGQRVRVIAERVRPGARLVRSQAVFEASADGVVNPTADAPVEGDWSEVDPFAFLWTMRQVEGELPEPGAAPSEVHLTADLDLDDQIDLTARLEFRTGGYVELDASDVGQGTFLLLPDGPGPHPAVIYLGGSEGGDSAARDAGPLLAQRGYAVLGVPYYSPDWSGQGAQFPDLPDAFVDIPIDLAERAHDWLEARDDIDAHAIGLVGGSKGAEFALAAAAYIGGFEAVALIVPTDVIWEGWGAGEAGERSSFSLYGEPLPFVPYKDMDATIQALYRGEDVMLTTPHEEGRAANPEAVPAARIPVERVEAPVYLLGGMVDRTWASGAMALTIAAQRQAAGLPTVTYVYDDAGHALFGPPTRPSGPAEAAAKAEAYPALLAFLDRALK